MKQTRDESRFIPFSCERGEARLIQKIRVGYSLLANMNGAHTSRLFLFRSVARGYTRALSFSHNHTRFMCKKILLPPRERAQERAYSESAKREERRHAIVALRYGRRYGTTTISTIENAKLAGIAIRRDGAPIASNAEVRRQIVALISSDMTSK